MLRTLFKFNVVATLAFAVLLAVFPDFFWGDLGTSIHSELARCFMEHFSHSSDSLSNREISDGSFSPSGFEDISEGMKAVSFIWGFAVQTGMAASQFVNSSAPHKSLLTHGKVHAAWWTTCGVGLFLAIPTPTMNAFAIANVGFMLAYGWCCVRLLLLCRASQGKLSMIAMHGPRMYGQMQTQVVVALLYHPVPRVYVVCLHIIIEVKYKLDSLL
jgi:hypothetical protein